MALTLEEIKEFLKVDYDDEDNTIELMKGVALETMEHLIQDFDKENLTKRQELLIKVCIKDYFENRDKQVDKKLSMNDSITTLLMQEMYK